MHHLHHNTRVKIEMIGALMATTMTVLSSILIRSTKFSILVSSISSILYFSPFQYLLLKILSKHTRQLYSTEK